jgi:hypothetical protein
MMQEKTKVSPFEFAIMQAVHETNPEKITKEDLASTRAETIEEKSERLKTKFSDFFSQIKKHPKP